MAVITRILVFFDLVAVRMVERYRRPNVARLR
jgi:hypothetical protein